MKKRIITNLAIVASLLALGIILHVGPSQMFYIASAEELEYSKEESVAFDEKIDYIFSYISDLREDDPLIEVEQDIWIKRSNIEGIEIDEQTYFYTLFPHMSYDPVIRGEVASEDIEIVYERDGEIPVLIYKLK